MLLSRTHLHLLIKKYLIDRDIAPDFNINPVEKTKSEKTKI